MSRDRPPIVQLTEFIQPNVLNPTVEQIIRRINLLLIIEDQSACKRWRDLEEDIQLRLGPLLITEIEKACAGIFRNLEPDTEIVNGLATVWLRYLELEMDRAESARLIRAATIEVAQLSSRRQQVDPGLYRHYMNRRFVAIMAAVFEPDPSEDAPGF